MNQRSLEQQIADLQDEIRGVRLRADHCERSSDAKEEYAYANRLEARLNELKAQKAQQDGAQ